MNNIETPTDGPSQMMCNLKDFRQEPSYFIMITVTYMNLQKLQLLGEFDLMSRGIVVASCPTLGTYILYTHRLHLSLIMRNIRHVINK